MRFGSGSSKIPTGTGNVYPEAEESWRSFRFNDGDSGSDWKGSTGESVGPRPLFDIEMVDSGT